MKVVLSALIILSGLAVPRSHAAPHQPAPKVLPKAGLPGPGVAQRGTVGGPVSNASGVNGAGINKPH